MKVIFHADDFGVSYGVNEAIEKAHLNGVLKSTSIRTNGAAFNDAVKRIKKLPNLGIGLHLNLTDGKTHLKSLANKKGYYKYSFPQYLFLAKTKKIQMQVYEELDEQFKICIKHKLKIDHVDGQDHIHMVPEIFNIICKLCVKYGVCSIRLSYEPLYKVSGIYPNIRPFTNGGFLKSKVLWFLYLSDKKIAQKNGLLFTDYFFGVLHTNFMTVDIVEKSILFSKKQNKTIIEIACHPGFPHDKRDKKHTSPFFAFYTNLPSRKMEFETLCSKELASFAKNKISLINFSDMMK